MALKPGATTKAAGAHTHEPVDGPLATATVTFGAWPTDPPLDRNRNNPSPLTQNVHQLIPNEVTIQTGGTVSFIIAGAHQVAVYANGVQPGDIRTTPDFLVSPAGGGPPILIDDSRHRIYRGLDFTTLPILGIPPAALPPPASPQFLTDRVEVVHFSKPGRYLVICTIVFHFLADRMYGFVSVLP
jgi:plastocyanin